MLHEGTGVRRTASMGFPRRNPGDRDGSTTAGRLRMGPQQRGSATIPARDSASPAERTTTTFRKVATTGFHEGMKETPLQSLHVDMEARPFASDHDNQSDEMEEAPRGLAGGGGCVRYASPGLADDTRPSRHHRWSARRSSVGQARVAGHPPALSAFHSRTILAHHQHGDAGSGIGCPVWHPPECRDCRLRTLPRARLHRLDADLRPDHGWLHRVHQCREHHQTDESTSVDTRVSRGFGTTFSSIVTMPRFSSS